MCGMVPLDASLKMKMLWNEFRSPHLNTNHHLSEGRMLKSIMNHGNLKRGEFNGILKGRCENIGYIYKFLEYDDPRCFPATEEFKEHYAKFDAKAVEKLAEVDVVV